MFHLSKLIGSRPELPQEDDFSQLFPENNKWVPAASRTGGVYIHDRHLVAALDNANSAAHDPDGWWLQAIHALWGRIDSLVTAYLVSLLKLNGITAGSLKRSPSQILARQHAELTFTYILSKLEGIPLSRELLQLPDTIGQSWADRGMPIDRLLPRFNMHFRVMWDSLIKHSDRDSLPILALNAEQIWTVVNDLSVEIQKVHSQIAARLARGREDLRRTYLKRLMEEPPTSREQLEQISEALEVAIDHSYVVFGAAAGQREVLRTAIRSILPVNSSDLIVEESDTIVAFVPASDWVVDALTNALTDISWVLAPVASDITEIASRARLIRALVPRMNTSPGVRRLKNMWDTLYAAESVKWSEMLVTEVLGELAHRKDPEAERIMETVAMYIRTGSTTTTSSALYCHRNTVLNRLRAFHDLSGHDLSVPREAAPVVMALAALEQSRISPSAAQ